MAMNLLHRYRCSSSNWAKMVADQLLPWALDGVELGPRTLEIGPGYSATLCALLDKTTSLTAVEIDDGRSSERPLRRSSPHHPWRWHQHRATRRSLHFRGLLHDAAPRSQRGIAGSAVRRGVQGVATGLRVRRW